MALGTSLTAFFTALSECAKAITADIEHKVTLSAVREDKRQEKAIVAANKAFDLLLQHIGCLPEKTQRELLKYKKTFDKNIT